VTVPDALRIELRDFEAWLGPRSGAWLFHRIRGQGGVAVEPDGLPKSMSRETTFATDLREDRDLERELLALSVRVAADLRSDGLQARSIGVKLRDHDFKTRLGSRTLPEPIDSDRAVYQVARGILAALRAKRRVAARLIGVALSRFETRSAAVQLGLLEQTPAIQPTETPRDRAIAKTVDTINRRFGQDAVRPARLARKK
jgi:DNA polymerase-4